MAFVKIRDVQIKAGSLGNAHFAADAAIAESKLDVDWATHYSNALATKLMLDYVQLNAVSANGTAIDNVIAAVNPQATPAGTELGVIVDATNATVKNKAIVRSSATGEPILDVNDREVYGRMTWDATLNAGAGGFKLSFYTTDGETETAYTFAAPTNIDAQYIRRFTLRDVDEAFSMNEKFVDGAADVTAHLNIEQLAVDIYGTVDLDRDGEANLVTPLVTQVSNEVTRATDAEGVLQGNIDIVTTNLATEVTNRTNADTAIRTDFASTANAKGASLVGIEDLAGKITATTVEGALAELADEADAEATARADADTAIRTDFASTANAKGASLIGIEDVAGNITATTVEGALTEIEGRVSTLEDTGGAEVAATHTRDAASTNGYFAQKIDAAAFVSLEARVVDVETVVDAKAKVADDTATGLATHKTDLAATDNAKGASLIGIEDSANKFAATTVEAALAELQTNIESEASTRSTADTTLQTNISNEATARANADTAIVENLASTTNAKGASLVGIEDTGNKITATTVEGALAEIATNLATEVTARTDADTALDTRVTTLEGQYHQHNKKVVVISAGQAGVSSVTVPDEATFPMGGSMDVFVNGSLQAPTVHYTETEIGVTGRGNAVDFAPDIVVEGDVVIFKWEE